MKKVLFSLARSKKPFLISISLLLAVSSWGQIKLSEEASISMVTFGVFHEELWSSWGHSAIRVQDPAQGIDWVYDFGRFSFEQENFYWNYALGTTYYSIGKFNDYPRLRDHYARKNRFVHEQVMNFTSAEVQLVFDALEENNRPENREYLYNYVYDNCATRLADIVDKTLPGRVTYDTSLVRPGVTIRDLMDEGLAYQPWGDLLIDLFLGLQIDKEADFREYLMMPFYIEDAFAGATIDRDSVQVDLVKETVIAYEPTPETLSNGFLTPFNVFVLLFFVVGFITNRNYKTERRTRWIDLALFSLVGFLGCICSFLWFGTEHLSKYNYNILWAIPFHLPAIWLLGKEKFQPFLVRYFRFTAVLYALILVFWALLPQALHQSLIPLILLLVLRAFYISYDVGKKVGV